MNLPDYKILIGDKLCEVTPEIVAALFAEMNSGEQAAFFNHVAEVSSNWGMSMQLQYITDEDGLNLSGRRVMQSIGEYSHWGLSSIIVNDVLKNHKG